MLSPRERMVVSAALLIRERGAHATAISDVLEHSWRAWGARNGGYTRLAWTQVENQLAR